MKTIGLSKTTKKLSLELDSNLTDKNEKSGTSILVSSNANANCNVNINEYNVG